MMDVSEFDQFFEGVHGRSPFPWQRRLAKKVCETGRWPAVLDLPTGTGKTAAIDVALFHLALDVACHGLVERRAPVRIVLVVDRRTVVDQAHERALKIRAALQSPSNPAVEHVRDSLAQISLSELPLDVALLRGGIARDDSWARSPEQPLVAVSTVDQVGSRLLFRGYGVSSCMRPIHAGLLGNDTLFLLDEVHLSQPFQQTLASLSQTYRTWGQVPLPDRWQVVSMSATPAHNAGEQGETFGLDDEDREHPVLRQRLEARKPVTLVEPIKVTGSEEKRRATFTAALCQRIQAHIKPGIAIGVVVNRVAVAREIFTQLVSSEIKAHCTLVTGRMRPLDRQRVERERLAPLKVDRLRSADAPPTIVVATQCIEAGADLDFDILVTECAALDALKQRLGRLNRVGDVDSCSAEILVRSDALEDDDPVYDAALRNTWRWLEDKREGLDFGLTQLPRPDEDELAQLVTQVKPAPALLPGYLDTWVQTYPVPQPDPDISLWLHGPQRNSPEVNIVWRAEISNEILDLAVRDSARNEDIQARIDVCPPSSLEAMTVPLHEAVNWLVDSESTGIDADVEGVSRDEIANVQSSEDLACPAWSCRQRRVIHKQSEVSPGDTLVVPCDRGGISHGCWDPQSKTSVTDLGTQAYATRFGRVILRFVAGALTRETLRDDDSEPSSQVMLALPTPSSETEESSLEPIDVIEHWIQTNVDRLVPFVFPAFEAIMPSPRLLRMSGLCPDDTGYYVLQGHRRQPKRVAKIFSAFATQTVANETTTDEDHGSFTGAAVTLGAHLEGVSRYAREFANRCGLPDALAKDLELAAKLHDVGKADPRFQQMLHGGSAFRAAAAPALLAKSATPATDPQARRLARVLSGYPSGYRHELLSLAMVTGLEDVRCQAGDWDLVLHLIASHHGFCRPLAPIAENAPALDVSLAIPNVIVATATTDHQFERLDSGVSDRFWELVRRYGWYGLAWLEAILRLADHRRSEAEAEEVQS